METHLILTEIFFSGRCSEMFDYCVKNASKIFQKTGTNKIVLSFKMLQNCNDV